MELITVLTPGGKPRTYGVPGCGKGPLEVVDGKVKLTDAHRAAGWALEKAKKSKAKEGP